MKDVGSSSLKVKGSVETARDRERERSNRPVKHPEWKGRGSPVCPVLTMWQALSQASLHSHMGHIAPFQVGKPTLREVEDFVHGYTDTKTRGRI